MLRYVGEKVGTKCGRRQGAKEKQRMGGEGVLTHPPTQEVLSPEDEN